MIDSLLSIFIIPIWITVFIVGSAIYYLLMILFGSKNIHVVSKMLARIFIISGFQRFKIEGELPDKTRGPYLYLFNHGSIFDPFMVIAAVPHYITGVGSKEQFSWPLWGKLAKRYGLIPIERKKIGSAVKSLDLLESAIGNGISAAISPEGTRTLSGKMNAFKKGPFHVAFNTGITIIPVALKGAYEAQNKNHWRIKPGKLKTVFGQPIEKNEYEMMDIDQLSKKVKNEIQKMLDI
jgi:1-acyl-sn-glycerol-3-phosphate acyltransferase